MPEISKEALRDQKEALTALVEELRPLLDSFKPLLAKGVTVPYKAPWGISQIPGSKAHVVEYPSLSSSLLSQAGNGTDQTAVDLALQQIFGEPQPLPAELPSGQDLYAVRAYYPQPSRMRAPQLGVYKIEIKEAACQSIINEIEKFLIDLRLVDDSGNEDSKQTQVMLLAAIALLKLKQNKDPKSLVTWVCGTYSFFFEVVPPDAKHFLMQVPRGETSSKAAIDSQREAHRLAIHSAIAHILSFL